MRFSWKALALAPLPAPLLGALALVATLEGGNLAAAFLIFFVIGAVVSYGATIVLLLPAMAIVSRFAEPTARRTALLGALLGAAAYLPLALVMWRASGDDSGPPSHGFVEHLLRDLADPLGLAMMLAFPLAGLATAALYWRLAGERL